MTAARPFFIIGHNPNTAAEARDFLDAGANALEPDIQFDPDGPDTYYVSENHPFPGSHSHDPEHSLRAYLAGLREYLTPPQNRPRLALIAFDVKNAPKNGDSGAFDVNAFLAHVAEHLTSHPEAAGVAVLVTVPSQDRSSFLARWTGAAKRVGIGIDAEDDPKIVKKRLGKFSGKYTYGNGVSILSDPDLYYWVSEAKGMQASTGGRDCRLVYPWVLSDESEMRDYLDLRVDGAIVGLDAVAALRGILSDPRYADAFALAAQGADPFADPQPPAYGLTVRTANVAEAGTDSPISFRLSGDGGSLTSVLQGSYEGMLERSSVNRVTLEGLDLGPLRSITLSSLSGGPFSGWLPDKIEVGGDCVQAPVVFRFGKNDWVTVDNSVTRTPEPAA
jgi:hypothetical protein